MNAPIVWARGAQYQRAKLTPVQLSDALRMIAALAERPIIDTAGATVYEAHEDSCVTLIYQAEPYRNRTRIRVLGVEPRYSTGKVPNETD